MKIDDLIDKIDMLQFFNQRAGRELWQEKPIDVQNTDIENADNILDEVKKYLDKCRWHDLRKNPEDLPMDKGKYLVAYIRGKGRNIQYADVGFYWHRWCVLAEIKVLGWKYIDPF